jgi:uncharacterized protein (TIGR02246 family)
VKEIIFHPEARAEMRESVEFYNARLDGLGLRFLSAVEETVDRVSAHPKAGAPQVSGKALACKYLVAAWRIINCVKAMFSWSLTHRTVFLKEENMRALIVAVALTTALCSTAIAGPQEEALQVLEKWTKAFTDSDVDGVVKLYASDALFLGTSSKTVVVKSEEIRKYFERALLNNRPRGATLDTYSATVLSDTAVVVAGLDTLTGVRDGKPVSGNGRVTFVVAKRGSDWQIVHFHRSTMPK